MDGVPELWFDDVTARTIAYTSPRIAECNVDSENFIGAVTRLVSEPRQVRVAPEADTVARILLLATGVPDEGWSRRAQTNLVGLPGLVGYTSHRIIEQARAPNSRISEMDVPVAGLAEAVFADESSLVAALAQLVSPQDKARTAALRVLDHRFV